MDLAVPYIFLQYAIALVQVDHWVQEQQSLAIAIRQKPPLLVLVELSEIVHAQMGHELRIINIVRREMTVADEHAPLLHDQQPPLRTPADVVFSSFIPENSEQLVQEVPVVFFEACITHVDLEVVELSVLFGEGLFWAS